MIKTTTILFLKLKFQIGCKTKTMQLIVTPVMRRFGM